MNLYGLSALLRIDTPLAWYSQTAQTKCECRLRIYQIDLERTMVIVSELHAHPGRSISNEAFMLIYLVCHEFDLPPGQTMWVEHYPAGYLKEEETYEQVMLMHGHVHSTRVNKQKLEALLGVKL